MLHKFKALGQPVTSEHGPKTHKCPKCDFADNLLSEQARVAIQIPNLVRWSLEYNSEYFTPTHHFGGQNSEINFLVINGQLSRGTVNRGYFERWGNFERPSSSGA